MESDELQFLRIGLSSDGAVIFCEMDNGKTYAMPLRALDRAEEWDPKAHPKAVRIIHDGYAVVVLFDTGAQIDFPSDFVRHVCDPSYAWHKSKSRVLSGVGARIREIRQAHGLTLDALSAKCGIAKPNLSRLENGKVTPAVETLQRVAKGLAIHLALLVPKMAWTQTRHEFAEWRQALRWKEPGAGLKHIPSAQLVKTFLATRPEHAYARGKLLKYAVIAPKIPEVLGWPVDADQWAHEAAAADMSPRRAKVR